MNQGSCLSQTECTAPAVCKDVEADIQRLFAPIAGLGTGGDETVFSSGTCVEDQGVLCSVHANCGRKETCSSSGTCQRRFGSCRTDADCRPGLTCAPNLVTVNAADTDGDGVADPFDNCPHRPNPDQADNDDDGVGNTCNRIVCRDGIDNDGDGAIDLDDDGCRSADDPSEEPDCDDGIDNDGDGDTDYPDDIGCKNASWKNESPECDDGVDNADNDDPPLADWDGAGQGDKDPQCVAPWDKSESPSPPICGLGTELVLLLPPLMWLYRRRGPVMV